MNKRISKKLISILMVFLLILQSFIAFDVNTVFGAPDNSSVYMVSTGVNHYAALKSNGTVWTWGQNSLGQLGNGTTTSSSVPVKVEGLSDIISVAAGQDFTAALKNDGTVWAWGNNASGQLGDETTENRSLPIKVSGITGVKAIAADSYCRFVAALKNDGTVWAWGDNYRGQFGDGTKVNRSAPIQVQGLANITAIAVGSSHFIALRNDGTVWGLGYNGYGCIGDGTGITERTSPSQMLISNVSAIDAGGWSSAVVKNDGTLWTTGYNEGKLGYPNSSGSFGYYESTPKQVPNISGIASVAMGDTHMSVLKTDGTVWTCGNNSSKQLGYGTSDTTSLAQVPGLSSIIYISAGIYSNAVIQNDGTVWTWGSGSSSTSSLTRVMDSSGIYFNVFEDTTPNTQTVTYNYAQNGGTSATKTTAIAAQGSAIDLTPTATKSGWDFVGWNTNSTAAAKLTSLNMGTSNITLYAIYSKTMTGTFIDYSGSTKTTRTASVTIYNNASSGSVTAPTQNTYTGWTSAGWSTATASNASPVTSYSISANTTFYGLYQRTLTLSYNANGGSSAPGSQTGTQYTNSYDVSTYSNPSFTLANAIFRNGYAFSKWAMGSTTGTQHNVGASVSISASTTMYAVWTQVSPNADTDGDGLPDVWELYGADFDGDDIIDLPLHQMGADPNKKDVFVEIDWMTGFQPVESSIKPIYEEFKKHNINLHIDFGPDSIDYVTGKKWKDYPGGSGGNIFAYSDLDQHDSTRWSNIINNNFTVSRRKAFHHSAFVSNLGGAGGYGYWPGQHTLVLGTMSSWAIGVALMHELGHNLGLGHGGMDGVNYKPNYLSSMNYLFSYDSTLSYKYSDHHLDDLDERSLNESKGVDPNGLTAGTNYPTGFMYYENGQTKTQKISIAAKTPIDFNRNGKSNDANITVDVNCDGAHNILHSQNDWGNLVFKSGSIGSFGAGEINYTPSDFEDAEIPDEPKIDELRELGLFKDNIALVGDADQDNKMTVKDATRIQKHVAKMQAYLLKDLALRSADADQDGKISVKDATVIQKYVAKFDLKGKPGENIGKWLDN